MCISALLKARQKPEAESQTAQFLEVLQSPCPRTVSKPGPSLQAVPSFLQHPPFQPLCSGSLPDICHGATEALSQAQGVLSEKTSRLDVETTCSFTIGLSREDHLNERKSILLPAIESLGSAEPHCQCPCATIVWMCESSPTNTNQTMVPINLLF